MSDEDCSDGSTANSKAVSIIPAGQRFKKLPKHVGIIMDGNGRWATNQGWQRSAGHIKGASKVRSILDAANSNGIHYVTLYAFSTENWARPADEINIIMELLQDYLLRNRDEMVREETRFRALGQVEQLPSEVQKVIRNTEEATQNCGKNFLNLCLSYGGRAEIVAAAQSLARDYQEGRISLAQITEKTISEKLYTAGMPDPDLIIRTGGECRISNFLLWQAAYAEIYVCDTCWPDFETEDFFKAVDEFGNRQRRYGRSDECKVADYPLLKEEKITRLEKNSLQQSNESAL